MLVRKVLQNETGISRRACFALFAGGSVRLNNQVCDNFKATCVSGDLIAYRSQGSWKEILVGEKKESSSEVLMLYKPTGYVVARQDRFQRTIYNLLPSTFYTRYRSAGRLDKETSGLLLLSPDGDLVHRLSHPSFHIPKVYRAVLHRPFAADDCAAALRGVETGMFDTSSTHTDILSFGSVEGVGMRTIIITLQEGKKRHIRRLLRQLGYKVLALHRQSLGPIQLGSLGEGEYRYLSTDEIASLYTLLDYAPKTT